MVSLLITIIFCLLTIFTHEQHKSTVPIIFLFFLLGPELTISNLSIDSLYVYELIIFIYIFVRKKFLNIGRKNVYIKLMYFAIFIYIFSWILFSRTDLNTLLTCVLGILKCILIIYECLTLNYTFKKNITYDIFIFILCVVLINTAFILFQTFNFNGSLMLLRNIFLSSDEYAYVLNSTYRGHYTRYGGLFKYPMHLGLFCALSFTFLLTCKLNENKKRLRYIRWIVFFLNMYNGIMSSTKSFFVGISVVYACYMLKKFIHLKNKKELFMNFIPVIVVIIMICFKESIVTIVDSLFGAYPTYYINIAYDFFTNFSTVFETRLGDDGAILDLLEIVKKNFFFGVGPSSVAGESVMDNAILVILHNGGIITLLLVLAYLCYQLLVFRNDDSKLLLVLAVIACGMGFQIWIASYLSIWVFYYLEVSKKDLKVKEIKKCQDEYV